MGEHDQDRAAPKERFTDTRRGRVDDEGVHGAESAAVSAGPDPEVAGTELEQAQKQAAEYLEHLQRLQAEFANFRKRVLKEQTRAVELASEPLVRRLLEVLDEFDLALMAAERKPGFEKFLHGVELVYAKLKDILGAEGLKRIEAE